MNLAEIRALRKEYPDFTLSDVSFDLSPGQITGFIGRNGAGKTTTIKAMLNLIHPTAGDISYFGLPLCGNEGIIKQRIGYSTGAVNYYPKKKIRDIAAVTKTFYENWDEDAYREYLSLFELDENKCPKELSEGMRVKFNLLLALSHRAELLILDEPTSGLDPFSRAELLDLFLTLKQRGVAILFSTHLISDLEKCADAILYLQKGNLLAAMPLPEFRTRFGRPEETLEDTMVRLERGEAPC